MLNIQYLSMTITRKQTFEFEICVQVGFSRDVYII